jgi:hypothetical protein
MKWHVKAAAFKLLSALPGGTELYRFSQERLTRSPTPTPERVRQKIEVGLQYFNWLGQHEQTNQLLSGVHLDFGAGWHPTIPLLYYALGVNRQLLFDIAPC